jgi:flagellar basal-body rod protein FlgF
VAINGEGYFVVATPSGEAYTRSGHFRLDEQKQLVTAEGYPVLSGGGAPITLRDASDVEITKDGQINANGTPLGSLAIVGFADEQALHKAVGGLYVTDQVPLPLQTTAIVQGALERSNVEPITQVTQMIELLRGFQAAQRLIVDQHEAQRRAIQAIAGVTA